MLRSIFLSLQLVHLTLACGSHNGGVDFTSTISANLHARASCNDTTGLTQKFAITNVKVFNGWELLPAQTVVIENGRIGGNTTGATEIDGCGQVLLPGLIDSHCHPTNVTHLQELTRYGVTTGLLMACPNPSLCESLRNQKGLADVYLGSCPAAALNSTHGKFLHLNASMVMANASQAPGWVAKQVAAGADFIKLIAETPGLSQDILTAATEASHEQGKSVICHAADYPSVMQALTAGVDQIHHVPLDRALDPPAVAQYRENHRVSVPTLIMMKGTAMNIPELNFSAAVSSAESLLKASVPVLVGTDANDGPGTPGTPGTPPFGSSIHDELQLLVQAGMSPLEALRAATAVPALVWGLTDRGEIEVGKRADLVLVQGDPTVDISATKNIQRVWAEGRLFGGM